MRVIADLVMNHTSADHPWFQESRTEPAGAKGDWYVWSATDERYPEARVIFIDAEPSNWTLDQLRGEYYWHRFFHHQPDLNYDNPEVQEAMLEVLRFWLDLGIDGFRLDAVPYLFEREETNGENLPETHEYLKRVRAEVDGRYPDRLLLAEANQWPEDVVDYFGDGDECQMCFHFPVMPRMFMALRREDATPVYEILDRTPQIPGNCQWGLFLRNHDELTLEMVTDEERDYMYEEYAKDPRMKINLGIRRRLAPLLDGGRDEIELMHAILFSLPGSPVLYYGDEIGMGDNVYLGDRDGVRTPMQWTGDRNAGFSRADWAQLYLQPLMDPVYGYQAVNVEAQLRSPMSFLRWLHRFVALRKEHPVFGLGSYEPLSSDNSRIFAHIRKWEEDVILCVHNLARSGLTLQGSEGIVEFRPVPGFAGLGRELNDARDVGAEQSNSSVVFDDELILKVFRRLEPGLNPELEMLRFLTEHGFPNIAALGGWYAYAGGPLSATLGILQQYVRGGLDGWELALSEIVHDSERFLSRLSRLGEVTGEMHSVLASEKNDG